MKMKLYMLLLSTVYVVKVIGKGDVQQPSLQTLVKELNERIVNLLYTISETQKELTKQILASLKNDFRLSINLKIMELEKLLNSSTGNKNYKSCHDKYENFRKLFTNTLQQALMTNLTAISENVDFILLFVTRIQTNLTEPNLSAQIKACSTNARCNIRKGFSDVVSKGENTLSNLKKTLPRLTSNLIRTEVNPMIVKNLDPKVITPVKECLQKGRLSQKRRS